MGVLDRSANQPGINSGAPLKFSTLVRWAFATVQGSSRGPLVLCAVTFVERPATSHCILLTYWLNMVLVVAAHQALALLS